MQWWRKVFICCAASSSCLLRISFVTAFVRITSLFLHHFSHLARILHLPTPLALPPLCDKRFPYSIFPLSHSDVLSTLLICSKHRRKWVSTCNLYYLFVLHLNVHHKH